MITNENLTAPKHNCRIPHAVWINRLCVGAYYHYGTIHI